MLSIPMPENESAKNVYAALALFIAFALAFFGYSFSHYMSWIWYLALIEALTLCSFVSVQAQALPLDGDSDRRCPRGLSLWGVNVLVPHRLFRRDRGRDRRMDNCR